MRLEALRFTRSPFIGQRLLTGLAGILLAFSSGAAFAQSAGANLPLVIGQGAQGTSYSVPIQTLLFFTALSFLPAVL